MFFQTEWEDFVTGKKDLKQHIEENSELWRWDKAPEELLKYWFDSQNAKNEPLLEIIQEARLKGVRCYIATQQEKYRTGYIRREMFDSEVDGVFSTAEIGFKKDNPIFFQAILDSLGASPENVLFFDDSQTKLGAAKTLGIQTYLYSDVDQAKAIIDRL